MVCQIWNRWHRWDMHLGLHSRKGPFWLGPDDFSTAVTSLGCALRVDFGETPVKSRQAHEASDLTPVEFSRTQEAHKLTPVKPPRRSPPLDVRSELTWVRPP